MTRKKKVCVSCDTSLKGQDWRNGDHEITDDGQLICSSCYESDQSEPLAYFYPIIDNDEDEDEEFQDYPETIGSYHNNTEGKFTVSWRKTDGWRGYALPASDIYTEVFEGHDTLGHPDTEALVPKDKLIVQLVKEYEIDAYKCASRTSNCLSMGYGIWVNKKDLDKWNEHIAPKLVE